MNNNQELSDDYKENVRIIQNEAYEWIRMANNIVWSAGRILIPASIAPFAILFTKTPFELNTIHRIGLAFISVMIAFIWCRITIIYYKTTNDARQKLDYIEKYWKDGGELDLSYTFDQSRMLGIKFKETNAEGKQSPNTNQPKEVRNEVCIEKILAQPSKKSDNLFTRNWKKLKFYWENSIIKLQILYAITLLLFWLVVIIYLCFSSPKPKPSKSMDNFNHSYNSSNNSSQSNVIQPK